MEIKPEIFRLFLQRPLFYYPDNSIDPFNYCPDAGELIFCFEIQAPYANEFEIDRKHLPGRLFFSGKAAAPVNAITGTGAAAQINTEAAARGKTAILPQGDYFFTQIREISGREKIIDLMAEVQQEILWQRLIPGKNCYLRYVYEDNSAVTQILRPFSG